MLEALEVRPQTSDLTFPKDDLLTIAAIAVLAFIASDLAHEVVGHGIGLFLAGGRGGLMTTTKLIADHQLPSPQWRIFDLGGPMGNLTWAAICLALLRSSRSFSLAGRLFLWSSAMFGLFWESGYLIKAGWSGNGDSIALIFGLRPAVIWRALLVLTGLGAYRATLRWLANDLHLVLATANSETRARLSRWCCTIYLSGGVTACAGALFDPRGPGEIFYSGVMTSFVASLGLGLIPRLFIARPGEAETGSALVQRNVLVVALAAIALLGFLLVLGPGVHATLHF